LLDDVVWTEIVRLLEDPQLIQNELDRRLAVAREADPTKRREESSVTQMTSLQWHCSCAPNARAIFKAPPSRSMAGQHPGSISTGVEGLLGQNDTRSFRLDVQLANDAAEVIILDAKKSAEIGAARNGRV
jgi:hypothetical protein